MDKKDERGNGMFAGLCRHSALKTRLQVDSSEAWCKREANQEHN